MYVLYPQPTPHRSSLPSTNLHGFFFCFLNTKLTKRACAPGIWRFGIFIYVLPLCNKSTLCYIVITKLYFRSWAWWYMPVIQVHGSRRQEELEFTIICSHIASLEIAWTSRSPIFQINFKNFTFSLCLSLSLSLSLAPLLSSSLLASHSNTKT